MRHAGSIFLLEMLLSHRQTALWNNSLLAWHSTYNIPANR